MTTAHELGRRPVPWPCELRHGVVRRLPEPERGRLRLAARIARTLIPAAEAAGAWVSTEALIRVARDPDTALRPAVAVVEGPLPYDGVVDTGLVLVVELGMGRLALWRCAGAVPVWVPHSRGVMVVDTASQWSVPADGQLTLPGRSGSAVAAADLCRLVAVSG